MRLRCLTSGGTGAGVLWVLDAGFELELELRESDDDARGIDPMFDLNEVGGATGVWLRVAG